MIKRRFLLSVALSLVAHMALFGLVAILGPEGENVPSPAVERAKDFQAFKEALREAAARGAAFEGLARAMIGISEEEMAEAFRQTPVLDSRLTGQEKAGLYKTMAAEAMANFAEGAGGRSALDEPLSRYFGNLREMPRTDPGDAFELVRIGDALDESARLFRVSRETAREIDTLLSSDGGTADHKASVLIQDGSGRVESVPGEYFYRESPYLQFVAVGAQLFYIVKGFPELPDAAAPATAGPEPVALPWPELSPSFEVVVISRARPAATSTQAPSARPALSLRTGEADRVLDELMTLSGDQQVRTFYREYLSRYDPDSPDLADLTSAFVYGNLGMLFIAMDNPLSRGFDLLEEIYYDNLSQDELVPFALENPGTRTGTAILLCLAASYEFERRAIAALDGSLDAAQRILAYPDEGGPFVHNRDVKAYVLREVYRDLAGELHRRGYGSLESALEKYRDEQFAIYDHLVRQGGEARSQALYAMGRLYWDDGETARAMATWKDIDPALARGTVSQIRQAITELRSLNSVDYFLDRAAASERGRLFDRIGRFHKWARR